MNSPNVTLKDFLARCKGICKGSLGHEPSLLFRVGELNG